MCDSTPISVAWRLSDGPPAPPSYPTARLCEELATSFGNKDLGIKLCSNVFEANGAPFVEDAKFIPKLDVVSGVKACELNDMWVGTLATYVFGRGAGDFPLDLSRSVSAATSDSSSSVSGGRRTPLYEMDVTPTELVGGAHKWQEFNFPIYFRAALLEVLTSFDGDKAPVHGPHGRRRRC